MFTGCLVLNLFGACWCIAGLLSLGAPAWLMGLPGLVSIVLTAGGWRASRQVPSRMAEEQKRAVRLVGVWSAAEGIGFFIAITVLRNVHLEVDIAPVLAVIVGWHFYPLARGLPVPFYYVTATALLAIGLSGFVVPPTYRSAAACLAAALVLWATSVARISVEAPRGRETVL